MPGRRSVGHQVSIIAERLQANSWLSSSTASSVKVGSIALVSGGIVSRLPVYLLLTAVALHWHYGNNR
jgi:hypothetical protein